MLHREQLELESSAFASGLLALDTRGVSPRNVLIGQAMQRPDYGLTTLGFWKSLSRVESIRSGFRRASIMLANPEILAS